MPMDYILSLPFRFSQGIYNFLNFWYIKSSKDFWKREMLFIKGVENDVGILINLKLITQPIFGDYTYMGKIIGPIFRLGRVIFGSVLIFLSFVSIVVSYILWLIFPIVAVAMTLKNLIYILVQ
jgi:hypothetical protein